MRYADDISPEELERIERFLNNEMDVAESAAFAAALESDATLRDKTEEVKLLLLGVKEAAVKEKLKEYHTEIKPATKTPVLSMKRLLVAASVIIVAGVAAWFFLINKTDADTKLYSKYYTPDPGLATVMSSVSNYEFEKAMVEYKNGDYNKALATWKQLLTKKEDNDTLIYFVGAASQAAGKEDEAIAQLQKIVANPNSAFYNDACWYLGLCYIKKGEKQQAKAYLEKSGLPQAAEIINSLHQ